MQGQDTWCTSIRNKKHIRNINGNHFLAFWDNWEKCSSCRAIEIRMLSILCYYYYRCQIYMKGVLNSLRFYSVLETSLRVLYSYLFGMLMYSRKNSQREDVVKWGIFHANKHPFSVFFFNINKSKCFRVSMTMLVRCEQALNNWQMHSKPVSTPTHSDLDTMLFCKLLDMWELDELNS